MGISPLARFPINLDSQTLFQYFYNDTLPSKYRVLMPEFDGLLGLRIAYLIARQRHFGDQFIFY